MCREDISVVKCNMANCKRKRIKCNKMSIRFWRGAVMLVFSFEC